jgi:hypothetical protein
MAAVIWRIDLSEISRVSPPNKARAMIVIVVRVASAAMSRRSPSDQRSIAERAA